MGLLAPCRFTATPPTATTDRVCKACITARDCGTAEFIAGECGPEVGGVLTCMPFVLRPQTQASCHYPPIVSRNDDAYSAMHAQPLSTLHL